MRSAVAAAASSSPRNFGMMTPLEVPPTAWPERPTRCSPEATDGGAPICTTRSIAPISMPSSSDEVATSARSRPALSASSISARRSLATEPWWAKVSVSPALSFSAALSRSAKRRLLTNSRVERCERMSSSRGPCNDGQIERSSALATASDMPSIGTSTRSFSLGAAPASITVTGRRSTVSPTTRAPPR